MASTDDLDTAYAEYLGAAELFALQGTPASCTHPEEVQFRSVHLVSELWLNLIAMELARTAASLDADELATAARLLRRCVDVGALLNDQLRLLESMPLRDYHAFRAALGTASGLQSPGYRRVHQQARPLWQAFERACERQGHTPSALYRSGAEELIGLAELIASLDATMQRFLAGHLQIAERFLGEHMPGTGGQGIDYLRKGLARHLFPSVWKLRAGEVG